ncbi:hypothetical protein V6O07_23075 [Arthrospira platensis SPKY2]
MMMNLDAKNMRFIVFLIDSKSKEHDGYIFCKIDTARRYATDCIDEGYCTHAVVGQFYMDKDLEKMNITMVCTYGFRNDKTNIVQLDLFK